MAVDRDTGCSDLIGTHMNTRVQRDQITHSSTTGTMIVNTRQGSVIVPRNGR